ncbi:uncharacterized protein SCHCODRAFT_02501255 [Schizophyllum commune H4-8]|nr:uncharacterized protein SCHCODRAFT_02501255 [Schizophyllum commune H4-8]KAI5893385.1 hypothetical protein SCHCODRAFT_02501255 [Schizophyllum commune H4-8]
MSDQVPTQGPALKALRPYMDTIDRREYACHPYFVVCLLQLEKRLERDGAATLATGATYDRLINFLVHHLFRVLAGSRSDPTLGCLKQHCKDMYKAHPYILDFCRSKCLPKGGKHRELAKDERTGVEVMLDILTRLNQVETFLHNAAIAPSASHFNLIIVWLKHKRDAVAPSLVRYPILASSPAVLLALIDAVANYAAGNAMNAHVLFSVAHYVAQCSGPSQGGAWRNFLRGLDPDQAQVFVSSCTFILNWMDVQGERPRPQIISFRENLIEAAAHLVAVRRLAVNEISCHRLIWERASGRVH